MDRWNVLKGVLAFAALLICTSCVEKTLRKQLAQQNEEIKGLADEYRAKHRNPQPYRISWNDAVRRLESHNPTLKQAASRVRQVKKTKNNQWKNWIPKLGLHASLVTSLSQLGSLTSSDIDSSIIAPLSIPNPVTERAQAFANALSYVEAKDQLELTYRRQVIALYRLFSQYEQMELRDVPMSDSSVTSELAKLEAQRQKDANLRSMESSLAEMLDLPGNYPVPEGGSRPSIDCEGRITSLVPGRNFGELAFRMAAYQIEAALLAEKGVKIERLPSAWVSSTTPAVYDSESGASRQYFDTERIYLFGGVTKVYDLTGRETEQVETAKENTEFVKNGLRIQVSQQAREWEQLQVKYRALKTRQKIAAEHLHRLKAQVDSGSASVKLTDYRSAVSQRDGINQSLEQIELEIWVWDDSKWRSIRYED